jgi:hypothetical protein
LCPPTDRARADPGDHVSVIHVPVQQQHADQLAGRSGLPDGPASR